MKSVRALGQSAIAAATLLAALALTGCGDEDPAAAPNAGSAGAGVGTEASSRASSEAREPRAPQRNEQLSAEGFRGLAATTYFFFDATTYALQTGDARPMLSAVAADCTECVAEGDRIEALYAEGGRIEGGQPKPQNVYPLGGPDAEGVLSAVVPLMQDAGTTYAPDGSVAAETEWDSDGTVYTVEGRYTGERWLLTSVRETPDAELPQ